MISGMTRLLTSLLADLTALIVAVAITPALIVCHFRPRPPLAEHDAYMRAEYPDIMAFTLAEMKIDNFLLELESR